VLSVITTINGSYWSLARCYSWKVKGLDYWVHLNPGMEHAMESCLDPVALFD